MAKCSFCSSNIEPGTGVTVIRPDGKIFHFDSRKCEASMLKHGRDARKASWVRKQKSAA